MILKSVLVQYRYHHRRPNCISSSYLFIFECIYVDIFTWRWGQRLSSVFHNCSPPYISRQGLSHEPRTHRFSQSKQPAFFNLLYLHFLNAGDYRQTTMSTWNIQGLWGLELWSSTACTLVCTKHATHPAKHIHRKMKTIKNRKENEVLLATSIPMPLIKKHTFVLTQKTTFKHVTQVTIILNFLDISIFYCMSALFVCMLLYS